MPKGGHARSGPAPDPNSGRSDARGLQFTALPASGHDGDAPEFPLPKRSVYSKEWNEAGKQVLVYDAADTQRVHDRELEFWGWLWTTPQACAWATASESWRLPSIALYARTFVICESGEATAADKGSLHRFADDIGMTPAGLRVNGWAIAQDEISARRATQREPEAKPQRRLRAANAQ
jgi:hypothetical protein